MGKVKQAEPPPKMIYVARVQAAQHGTGFSISLETLNNELSLAAYEGRMYFSDWNDVQSAFNRDLGLLTFLRTGKYDAG